MSKCNCFEQVLKDLDAEIREQIPDNAQEVFIDWENRVFMFDGADGSPVHPRVKAEFRKAKRNGELSQILSKESFPIFPTYCMFCGRKYHKGGGES